jgi:hypothetical protein
MITLNRERKLKQLSEHHVNASKQFLLVDRLAEFSRTVLEIASLVEVQLPAMKGKGAGAQLCLLDL